MFHVEHLCWFARMFLVEHSAASWAAPPAYPSRDKLLTAVSGPSGTTRLGAADYFVFVATYFSNTTSAFFARACSLR